MPATAYSWTPVIVTHALAAGVAVALGAGLLWGRKGQRAHRKNMIALYIGALVITGLFTLLPGRLIGSTLWGWLGR